MISLMTIWMQASVCNPIRSPFLKLLPLIAISTQARPGPMECLKHDPDSVPKVHRLQLKRVASESHGLGPRLRHGVQARLVIQD